MEQTTINVEVLQSALTHFEARLFEAKQLHALTPDDGRSAALAAVKGVIDFVVSIPTWQREGLAVPLGNLGSALSDLDVGAVDPLLKPAKPEGRPQDTRKRQAVRAFAAATVELLLRTGFARSEACTIVARHLEGAGVAQHGYMRRLSGKTVAGWRDGLSCTTNQSFAARQYREFLQAVAPFTSSDREGMKRALLQRLTGVLQATASTTVQKKPPS